MKGPDTRLMPQGNIERDFFIKNKPIKVIINSTYSLGYTDAFSNDNDDIFMELEPGTTVEGMLLKMPSMGSPDRWDDIMLHVFVNHEIAGFDQVLKDNDIIDLLVPASGG
jgi:molybdopterin converting factor small subunit